ncbi:hypothetical protein L7H23_01090 [Sphingopyxis sp. BSN-002]|uniref:hypothetical protein n=1 Tax=Sphingopyxis sp. BSN-002 TaxID=2911495 RepID=UPI001ED9CD0E|nr:hypothetical protein [Sphingopyxis sp. BSN-002]QVJ07667.1 hypothetical protein [Sphingopyxis phage VSN-002]UKK84728.1 hypothetical protein L7H23_01090 [Sphingopyxis sp. BSN-002]
MPLRADLELAAITLPLDIVLRLAEASKGKLSEETVALLKIEVASVLMSIPGIEEEVVMAIFNEAFGP